MLSSCPRVYIVCAVACPAALGSIKTPARAGGIPSGFVTSEKKGGGGSGKTGVLMREVPYIYHTYILPFGNFRPSYAPSDLHRVAILLLQQLTYCLCDQTRHGTSCRVCVILQLLSLSCWQSDSCVVIMPHTIPHVCIPLCRCCHSESLPSVAVIPPVILPVSSHCYQYIPTSYLG